MFAAAAALSAWQPAAATDLPDSGELACVRVSLGECDYRDRTTGLLVHWPVGWPARRLKLVTETGPAARARQRDAIRWIAIEYSPDDMAQPEASLLRIAVIRRADWLALSAQPTPPPGVEVATGRDHVAVASVQAVNPYPPGSLDAEIFDALRPGFEEISLIVRLLPSATFRAAPSRANRRTGQTR
jgi:hypothetical protein